MRTVSAFLLGTGFRADMGTCVRKLVLLKLIDACEDDGSRIFPAMSTVARAAQCSTRTVQREIQAFLEIGLLRLVREGGKGPRSTNEYALDLDVLNAIGKAGWDAYAGSVERGAAQAKGDTVSPLADAEKGDTDDRLRVTPATPKGDTRCHTTPPDSSIDPSEERARECEGLGEEGSEPDEADDPRKFEKRVKRLADRHNWPSWANSSTAWTVKQFAALSDAERAEAEAHAAAYIAACGRKALSLGSYFAERKWRDLPAEALAPKVQPSTIEAKPFGPVWGAIRFREFLTVEPQAGPPPTAFQADLLARADEMGQRERMARQARYGWPKVNHWHERAESRKGFTVSASDPAINAEMEFVPAGSAMWSAWEAEHVRCGWPWIPDPGGMRGAWFPKGGPGGLEGFMAQLQAPEEGERR